MPTDNTASKFTVSVPSDLAKFIEQYQKNHQIASRSEVIARGLQNLRDAELAAAYRDHAKAWQKDPEREFWDQAAVADGIDGEESTW
jgi:Arc/MetJ-type ribon-helix-helix transcriptional regulator